MDSAIEPKVLCSYPLTSPPAAFPSYCEILTSEADLSFEFGRRWPSFLSEHLAKLWLAVRLLLLRHRYQVIVTGRYGELFALLQSFLPFGKKPHLLLDVEWYAVHSSSWRNRLNRWYHARIVGATSLVQVFCEVEADNYSRYYGVPKSSFVFIPYAPPDPPPAQPATGDYLLSSGFHQRDYPTLFAAVDGLPVEVRIVANPAAFAGMSLPKNVSVLGLLSPAEYFAQLAGCRFMVLSLDGKILRRSGVITYATALRTGKTCVINDPFGAASYIRNGQNGFLVPPAQPDALRSQIATLLADPAQVAAASHAAGIDTRLLPAAFTTAVNHAILQILPNA